MTTLTQSGAAVHPVALMHADEYRDGKISRREFLTRATSLGLTATEEPPPKRHTWKYIAASSALTAGILVWMLSPEPSNPVSSDPPNRPNNP